MWDFYPEEASGNSANFYPDSTEAFEKFLAKFYPDFPQGVKGIIGGPATKCLRLGLPSIDVFRVSPYN